MTKTLVAASGATGVGKTALVATLGVLLAQRGQRVRCVGLDRQCTLTLSFGAHIDPEEGELYVADLLKGKPRIKTGERDASGAPIKRMATIADVELPTEVPGLTLVPEAAELETDILALAQLGGVGSAFADALAAAPPVDVNLVDAPGELNVLTGAALAAADEVIVVVSPTIKQTRITRLLERIQQLRDRGSQVRLVGIVPNIVPSRRDGGFYADVLDELKGEGETPGYPGLVLPAIRRQHVMDEAFAFARPAPLSYPSSEVVADYHKLLADLDKRSITPSPDSSGAH